MGAKIRRVPGISVKVKTACEELNQLTGKVGWFESAVYPDGTPVAYVATIHEFGSPAQGIPPRPFMRPTVAENGKEWTRQLGLGANKALTGAISAEAVMDGVTELAKGDIYKTLFAITSPELKQATIDARLRAKSDKKHVGGLTKPLIDTGYMADTLTAVTEKK